LVGGSGPRAESAQARIETVGQASVGWIGVRLAREVKPDVVLMYVRMPDLGGIVVTREIVENHRATRMVVTVASENADIAGQLASPCKTPGMSARAASARSPRATANATEEPR
jgi:chemotaxis response regulator CheB